MPNIPRLLQEEPGYKKRRRKSEFMKVIQLKQNNRASMKEFSHKFEKLEHLVVAAFAETVFSVKDCLFFSKAQES